MKYILLLLISINAFALDVPTLTNPVVDLASILNPDEEDRLNNQIRSLHQSGLIQISVLTIESLEGEVLEDYSIKVAQTWGLGSEIKDNGLLILLAMKERKIRIEVGQGIEGDVTDYLSSRIISKLTPYMRTKEYEEGLRNSIQIIESAMKENSPENKELIRQQEIQAAVLRMELEKKRMQEKEREDKEHAKKMEELKNFAEPIAVVVLICLSSYFFYGSFQHNKKIASVEDLIKKEAKKEKELRDKLEETKSLHSQLKIDQEKYNFVILKEEVKSLKQEKNKLTQTIAQMRSYLGV